MEIEKPEIEKAEIEKTESKKERSVEELITGISENHKLSEIPTRIVVAILIWKFLKYIGVRLKKKSTILFIVFLLLYVSFNTYFKFNPQVYQVPSELVESSVFTKEQIKKEPIHSLTIQNYKIDNLAEYLVFKIYKFKYIKYIDNITHEYKTKGKEIKGTNISIGNEIYDMQMSAFLAYNKLIGKPREYKRDIIVTTVEVGGKEPTILLPYDKIVEVDGKSIKDSIDVEIFQIQGGVRDVKVQRGSETHSFKTTLESINVKSVITLTNLSDYEEFYDFANISLEGYTGRSAGASIVLSYYNRNIEDVSKGRNIALTGTINPEGEIGIISGVKQKTASAIKEGVDIIFVPKDTKIVKNYTEADKVIKEEKTNTKLVAVSTIEDIINYLKNTE